MKIKIYRGTHEIGGTCVELTADNGKILWIDLGAPLDKKNPNTDYIKNKPDALLISHSHQDHYGLMDTLGNEVPIYIGDISLNLINAAKLFLSQPVLSKKFIPIKSWKSFKIADTFKIKPYLVDHSSPEAFAFLIEADNKKIFYSGDFRSTGRKKVLYDKLIARPPKNIDLLLLEGTMVGRSNNKFPDEDSIEDAIFEIIKNQKNLSFVLSSGQNIDRFVSVFRACKKAHKKIVVDIYNAYVLDVVKKKSPSLPTIDWDIVNVYEHPDQLEKINTDSFKEFKERIKINAIGNKVYTSPSDYVYFVRCPIKTFVESLLNKNKINVIYSQWEGYLTKEHSTYFTEYVNELEQDNKYINFHKIHTSGHATIEVLKEFAKAINPKLIIPIHTEKANEFKNEFNKNGFGNVCLWKDNFEYKL